jgi:hypothetical protein
MDKIRYGVHRTHCCIVHGCKYGDEDCPVVNREIKQDYICESCSIDGVKSVDDIQSFYKDLSIDYKQKIIIALKNEKENYDSYQRYVWNESHEAYESWKKHVEICEVKIELLESLLKDEEM